MKKYLPWNMISQWMVKRLQFGQLVKSSSLIIAWLFALLILVSQAISFHTSVRTEGLLTTERIADSLSEKLLMPLMTGDYELATNIINKSVEDRNIQNLELVVTVEGGAFTITPNNSLHKTVFSKFINDHAPEFLRDLAFPVFNQSISITKYGDGEFPNVNMNDLGELRLALDFTETLKRQGIILLFGAVLLISAILFLGSLSRKIEENVSRPLSNLLIATRRLSKTDFTEIMRLEMSDQREVAELIERFIELNQVIVKRKQELDSLLSSREQIISERTASLEDALVKANQSAQSKSNFINIMSHELNQPLFSARMALTNMSRQSDAIRSETIQHYISIVHHHLDNARGQIKHVLEYTGKGKQSYTPKSESFDFYRLVESLISSHAASAIDKKLYLDFHVAEHLPNMIVSCPDGWRQILNNLIGNAIKYTEQGGVVVRIGISEFLSPSRFTMAVTIEDTGIGIETEDLDKIFEYYTQAGDSTKRTQGGYGIGLGIVDNYVKALGGERSVQSSSAGSVFRAVIPVSRAAKPVGSSQAACINMIEAIHPYFVVFDSRLTWREGLASRLVNAGANAICTNDVRQAIDLINRMSKTNTVICIGRSADDALLLDHLQEIRLAGPELVVGMQGIEASTDVCPIISIDMILPDAIEITDLMRQIHNCLDTEGHSQKVSEKGSAPENLAQKRILLIDDNRSNLDFTQEFLKHYGAEVDTAHGPEEGLKAANHFPYDAICVDIMMPGMNGIELASMIRTGDMNKSTALFAFTAGYLDTEQIEATKLLDMSVVLKMDAKDKLVSSLAARLK